MQTLWRFPWMDYDQNYEKNIACLWWFCVVCVWFKFGMFNIS